MRLLYITNGICGVGGLERVLSIKTRLLIERYQYEIHIIGLKERSDKSFYPFHPNIIYHLMEFSGNTPRGLLKYLSDVRKLVRNINPDVVDVCDDGFKAFLLPYIFKKRDFALIYERHIAQEMTRRKRFSSIVHFLQRHCAKKFDRFVLLSKGHRSDWDTGNVEIIPNMTPFRPLKPSDLSNKRIIAVGKVSEQKAYEFLLEAWILLESQFPDWEVCIYGEERDGGKLRTKIETCGAKHFHLMGRCSDMEQAYLKSSIHVMTSRFEGLPMVMIEAQSCGLPSVSFDCPYGPSDIIVNGENGYIVPAGDVAGLREKLNTLMSDRKLLLEQGHAAFLKAEAYSEDVIITRWHTLFSSIEISRSSRNE